MNASLPPQVVSAQDLTVVIHELADYTSWATHETIKQRVGVAGRQEVPVISPAATELLSTWANEHGNSVESYRQLIETLERVIASSPTITITLAGPAPQAVREHLVTWCRKNLSANVLVTFAFNRTLLGGMVVRAGSRIFDWSLRRRLMDHGREFTEVLARV